jgi:AcrR family transcriptional regulator
MTSKLADKAPDRRIAKTRSALGQALFTLMQTTDWNDISVQAICDTANVARSSFYAHFSRTGDLLESLISENFPDHTALPPSPDGIATIDWLVEHVSQNRKLFFRLINVPSSAAVLSVFRRQAKTTLMAELSAQGVRPNDTELAFLIGGIFESIQIWAKTWKTAQLPPLKMELQRLARQTLRQ